MSNSKIIYSVFSGTFYEVPEKDIQVLNIGQLPLVKKPSTSCKKCYGKGHNGRDLVSFVFQVCTCIRKNIDFNLVKK